jgi:hypothetical protein
MVDAGLRVSWARAWLPYLDSLTPPARLPHNLPCSTGLFSLLIFLWHYSVFCESIL